MIVTFTALSPKKDSTALAKTQVKVYADKKLLRVDTTGEDGIYDEIFFLRRICADSLSFIVCHPDYGEFLFAKYPTIPDYYYDKWCHECLKSNRNNVLQTTTCSWKISPFSLEKSPDFGRGFSGRVFNREDFQYTPKKE